jgi:hypothetical protein
VDIRKSPRRRARYRVTDPALLWKEVFHGAGPTAGWTFWGVYLPVATFGVVLAAVLLMSALIAWREGNGRPLADTYRVTRDGLNLVVRGLGIVLAGAWCVGLAWQAAGSITRERDRRTLDGLLALPVSRTAVLGAKWLGGVLRLRWLGYLLLAVWTVGLVSGALHPAAVLLLAAACATHVAFLASLGVWLSLVNRTTLWAYLSMALMLLLMFTGSWVFFIYSQLLGVGPGGGGWWDDFVEVGLNPARCWWFLGFGWEEFAGEVWGGGLFRGPLGAALAGLFVYATAAAALWLAACRRFRGEMG